MSLRILFLSSAILAATTSLCADQLSYNFTTSGIFGGTHPDLAFTGQSSAVSGTTVGGAASSLPLGTFTLTRPDSGTTDTYTNLPFTLDVLFTSPTGIAGGNTGVFGATLNGTITRGAGSGDLDLVFSPGTESFTFNDGSFAGSFTFGITNGGIADMDWSGESYALTGFIREASETASAPNGTLASTPEPGSIGLLATALGGLVFKLRRKRS